MSEFLRIDPLTDKRWNEFIKDRPEANIFHTAEWMSTLKDQYNYPVFCLILADNEGKPKAAIPFCEVRTLSMKKKWISLPFSDYVPPVYDDEADLKILLEKIIEYRNNEFPGISSIEIRYSLPSGTGFKELNGEVLYVLKLIKDKDKIFSAFKKKSVSQIIMKSTEKGLYSEIRNDKYAMDEFYRLHLITRQKLGVPIQPRRLFDRLLENVISKDRGFIVIVKNDENKILAAGIMLGYNETVSIKYAASDRNYLNLRPNNIMYWGSIQESVDRDYSIYDFGKTEVDNTGLRRFKSHWGTEMQELPYNYYPETPVKGSGKVEKILAFIIQRSPKFVCRFIGELLYRFAT